MTNPISPPPGQPGPGGPTFFERVGGHPTFDKLTAEFYRGVADDPELRALYPEEDLGPAEDRLRMFLEQYWGGPNTYSQLKGHPRLRMRHAPFAVTPEQRDRWLTHMRAAVLSLDLASGDAEELWQYLVRAAHAMVNQLPDATNPMPRDRGNLL